jgi:hypothetical protein
VSDEKNESAAPVKYHRGRIYVAGPMTGLPEYNYPAFHAAAERLRSNGHTVLCPAEHPEGLTYAEYMRRDILMVLVVEAIAVLPGWEKSRGAQIEVSLGRALDLPILDAETLEPVVFA